MTTRPPSNDPADIAAWEEEKDRLREEKEFREDMRSHAADTKVRLEWLADSMKQHAEEDRKQFAELHAKTGNMSQSIDKNSSKLAVIWATCGALVTIFGIVWAVLKD